MQFIHDDGGRAAAGFKGSAGDCVARAIAIVSGRPYAEVYRKLADGQDSERKSKGRSARNGIHVTRKWFKDYMASIGFTWVPTMAIGSGCKTHLTDGELPMGRLVVSVSKHYTSVIDGVIRDTHDPQRDMAIFEKFPGWEDCELKAGQKRNQNGVFTISRRCVYGYWILKEQRHAK